MRGSSPPTGALRARRWRSPLAHGFELLQLPGPGGGLGAERLGDEPAVLAAALREAGVFAVMEMLVRVGPDGRTEDGGSGLDALRANLPALEALGIELVHVHYAPAYRASEQPETIPPLEDVLLDDLERCAAVALQHGLSLSLEHNQPGLMLFAEPARCAQALERIPSLGFVWDVNHTPPESLAAFLALAPRMRLVHVSDTPLPLLNGHLGLGRGGLDLAAYVRGLLASGYDGPFVLEVGGHPSTGGFGQDTDDVLLESLSRLRGLLAVPNLAEPAE